MTDIAKEIDKLHQLVRDDLFERQTESHNKQIICVFTVFMSELSHVFFFFFFSLITSTEANSSIRSILYHEYCDIAIITLHFSFALDVRWDSRLLSQFLRDNLFERQTQYLTTKK